VPALPWAGVRGSLFDQRAVLHEHDGPDLRIEHAQRHPDRVLQWDRRSMFDQRRLLPPLPVQLRVLPHDVIARWAMAIERGAHDVSFPAPASMHVQIRVRGVAPCAIRRDQSCVLADVRDAARADERAPGQLRSGVGAAWLPPRSKIFTLSESTSSADEHRDVRHYVSSADTRDPEEITPSSEVDRGFLATLHWTRNGPRLIGSCVRHGCR
jgi:hypothetical protein